MHKNVSFSMVQKGEKQITVRNSLTLKRIL